MLLSPRQSGLDFLFKEVRVFEVSGPQEVVDPPKSSPQNKGMIGQ